VGYLKEILNHKVREINEKKKNMPVEILRQRIYTAPLRRNFKDAISIPGEINLIAEIKKASPSAGMIRGDLNPVALAKEYELAGAKAISVVTDGKYFHGSLDMLKTVKENVHIPVLRKDFIIDEYQIYESAAVGADAILLIASCLSVDQIMKFLEIARKFDMDCLVETHSMDDMEKVLKTDAEIIGINNRNLETFFVDTQTTLRLKILVPAHKIVVSESGISTSETIGLYRDKGINAVLIGETLLRSKDVKQKIKELFKI
jgi:indole-3-glycerol phosphate synthase